jgi:hypothetical protein
MSPQATAEMLVQEYQRLSALRLGHPQTVKSALSYTTNAEVVQLT